MEDIELHLQESQRLTPNANTNCVNSCPVANGSSEHTQVRMDASDYAVLVRHAEKSYRQFVIKKGRQILRNLDLSVQRSTVYALLGPSGCGKTTLLRCIIGRLRLDSGFILVFGHVPGTKESGIPGKRLGYMPQDIALYKELTINENLQYYGKAFGMSNEDLKTKTNFLVEFLDLPREDQMFGTLSGGQQRRVSFATALLHDPELLIVDEPTVGVDSVLRKRIWNYLHNLAANSNRTIIITTHYIEEARKAHTVGMMHDGVIITENSPEDMIAKHHCITLEEVFLQLCIEYESKKEAEETGDETGEKRNGRLDSDKKVTGNDERTTDPLLISATKKGGELGEKDKSLSMDLKYDGVVVVKPPNSVKSMLMTLLAPPRFDRIYATTLKNLRRTYRDYKITVMQVITPLLLMTAYALAFGSFPNDLPVGIVNLDEYGMGETYLSYINTRHIIQKPFPTLDAAEAALQNGDTWGTMQIGPNFSQAFMVRFLHGALVDNDTIAESTIKVNLDLSNQPIALTIFREIHLAFQQFGRKTLERAGLETSLADLAIDINENIYGEEERTFMDFAAPGLILSCIYFISICLTILSFFLERLSGQIERSSVAGITSMEITLGFVFSCFTMMGIQATTLLTVTFLFLGVMCRGSIILVSLLTLGQGLCGMTFGLVISALCDSEYTAAMLALGGFLPNLCLSGVFWPLEGMPYLLQKVTVYLPQTYAVTAMRDIMGRGWGITYESVYLGFIITTLWSMTFFMMAAVVLRIKG